MSKAQLIVNWHQELAPEELAVCEDLAARRETGEPMAYILGWKEFYGRNFAVNSGVLVPRPETELLIDAALAKFPVNESVLFADLGCGSGCILATLLLEAEAWQGCGVEVSEAALAVSRENIKNHGVSDRARLVHADFTENPFEQSDFDLIVSNPPYISSAEYESLGFEVRNFEPRLALESGPDGLNHPRQVVALAEKSLKPGGWLLMEIGSEQGEAAAALLDRKIWRDVKILADLAGLDRIVSACKN